MLAAITGHVIAPILSHSLCNYIGFPDIDGVAQSPHKNSTLAPVTTQTRRAVLLRSQLCSPTVLHFAPNTLSTTELAITYVVGLVAFGLLLAPVTSPAIYHSIFYGYH